MQHHDPSDGASGAPASDPPPPLLYDAEGTCNQLGGISRATLYRKVATGELPAPVRLGGRSLWRYADLVEFAESLPKAC